MLDTTVTLWLKAILICGVVWVGGIFVRKSLEVRAAVNKLGNCPGGAVIWLHPFRTLSAVLAPVFPFKGSFGYYFAQFDVYRQYGSTCLSSVIFWTATTTYWLSDADAIKAANRDRPTFLKDVDAYEALNIYGPSIIGTENSVWKRHRSVAKTAFNESNNAFVWREAIRIMNEWVTELEKTSVEKQKYYSVDTISIFTQITLLVISSAGFGRHTNWTDDTSTEPPPGHRSAFLPAVVSAVHHIYARILSPSWLFTLSDIIYIPFISPLLRETRDSFDALGLHMLDVVSHARAWVVGGRTTKMDAALLKNLVEANMIQEGDSTGRVLSDEELLSDTFIFLLAGHETSAHTLSFCTLLMALYPEYQEKVYKESIRLWPDGPPTLNSYTSYKDSMSTLEYTSAFFHETLRHYPSVVRLAKTVQADTTIPARRFKTSPNDEIRDVEPFMVPIKAGSVVMIDVLGLHMNPIHWGKDAHEFNPERFIDTDDYHWPRDAFMAFSSGPRNCIGRRFATTESVCLLANIVRRYEVLLPEEISAKSFQEQRRILLEWKPGPTIVPKNGNVRLRRRT